MSVNAAPVIAVAFELESVTVRTLASLVPIETVYVSPREQQFERVAQLKATVRQGCDKCLLP